MPHDWKFICDYDIPYHKKYVCANCGHKQILTHDPQPDSLIMAGKPYPRYMKCEDLVLEIVHGS